MGYRQVPSRAARLKAALRENLKRRKAQARGREGEPPEERPPVSRASSTEDPNRDTG